MPRWQVLSRVTAALLGLIAGLTLIAALWPSGPTDEQVLGRFQHATEMAPSRTSPTTAPPKELLRAGHSVSNAGATEAETPLLDPNAEPEHDHSTHDHDGIESEEGGTHGDDHWTATLSNGALVISGAIPDEASAGRLVQLIGETFGPANVVEQYTIDPNAVDVSHGHVRIDDALLFDFNSSSVDPADPLLEQATALANMGSTATLSIIGHTDRSGPADYNLRLAQERATAVGEQLIIRGVAPERIRAVGRGEEEPIADSSTSEARALNRRIEFSFENILAAG